MCGRFNVTSDPLTVLLMELVGLPHPGPDNFNAAPTETIQVLRLDEAARIQVPPDEFQIVKTVFFESVHHIIIQILNRFVIFNSQTPPRNETTMQRFDDLENVSIHHTQMLQDHEDRPIPARIFHSGDSSNQPP